jgi:hypothetical protein
MIGVHRSDKIARSLLRQRERLTMAWTWNATYALLPMGLISVLLIFTSLETNKRIRSSAKPINLVGIESFESKLWFSIAPSKEGIRITTRDGDLFEIENSDQKLTSEKFEAHVRQASKKSLVDIALANRMTNHSTFVVLSVDETLTYYHVRPVVYALANAGITNYGFEGRIVSE